jgi:hypothetical protein
MVVQFCKDKENQPVLESAWVIIPDNLRQALK